MVKTIVTSSILNHKSRLENCLNNIPRQPGCYLMLDSNDNVLYVGKSKNLYNRVRSYFNNIKEHSPRILLMVNQVNNIEYIITDNEIEALTLESNLIKSKQPYFNILLKDDKKYPYICITWGEKYPRVYITRRRRERNNKDKYYGPFVDVNLLRKTLFIIKSNFPLRQRATPLYKDRTCLNYSIERCPGVCQEKINPENYRMIIKKIEMIFQGRTNELKNKLLDKMNHFADNMEYELASKVRDQIKGLDLIGQSQKMTMPDSSISRDILAVAVNNKTACIQLFQMRSGKLVGRIGYVNEINNESNDLILQKTIENHYSGLDRLELPKEILTQFKLPNEKLISDWLGELKGQKVIISNPKLRDKAKFVDLVYKNAVEELKRIQNNKDIVLDSLEDLSQLLQLTNIPKRIEGYDISHIQGSDAVASQVVFVDGIPAKQHYRKYKITNSRIKTGYNDDYSSIKEVISRRFKRWSRYKKDGANLNQIKENKLSILDDISLNDFPDLLLIDGGKGQLNAAVSALKELGLYDEIPVCSLAKKNEEVYLFGISKPLNTNQNDPGILLLRKIRNEAHRFAVSFHKTKRSSRMTRSQLSQIPGLGPKKIKELLKSFSSVDAIKLATVEDITKTPGFGPAISKVVWQYFNNL